MLKVPPELMARFDTVLERKSLEAHHRFHYRKWLQYYLDFCHKYHPINAESESLSDYLRKLREKQQKEFQINNHRLKTGGFALSAENTDTGRKTRLMWSRS